MSDTDGSSFLNISDTETSQPSLLEHPTNDSEQDLDSLPSEPDSDDVTVSDDELDAEADREWKESLQQLELLLGMVVVPYLGKYFGRKFAFWGWKQLMEWRYPVEIVMTSSAAFKGTGIVAASL